MSKWLLRKASGSRAQYKSQGDYAAFRHAKKDVDFEHLPQKESMRNKHPHHTYLDTTLVKRWLYSKVGQDFDEVYAEFLTRIQPKYLEEYRSCIYWYVAPKEQVDIRANGEIWGKWEGRPVKLPYSRQMTFYVNPHTNVLLKLPKE